MDKRFPIPCDIAKTRYVFFEKTLCNFAITEIIIRIEINTHVFPKNVPRYTCNQGNIL